MIRAAIAGMTGFIGGAAAVALPRHGFRVSGIPRSSWSAPAQLAREVAACEVILFAAGGSRSADGAALYRANMALTTTLTATLDALGWRGHLYSISTTHEAKDTPYHASKRDMRRCFDDWAARSGARHTGILVPNTFGPGGKIFYNSAVCTFAWQIAHGEAPVLLQDARMELLYIDTLTAELARLLADRAAAACVTLPGEFEIGVSAVIARLQRLQAGEASRDRLDECLARTLQAARQLVKPTS